MSTNLKISINGRIYAENLVATLWEGQRTAYGEFAVCDNGVHFFDGQGKLEVFLCANDPSHLFFVNARATDEGIFYNYSTTNDQDDLWPTGYDSADEATRNGIWDALKQAKQRGKGYVTKKAKAGQYNAMCILLGISVESAKQKGLNLHGLDILRIEQMNAAFRLARA